MLEGTTSVAYEKIMTAAIKTVRIVVIKFKRGCCTKEVRTPEGRITTLGLSRKISSTEFPQSTKRAVTNKSFGKGEKGDRNPMFAKKFNCMGKAICGNRKQKRMAKGGGGGFLEGERSSKSFS